MQDEFANQKIKPQEVCSILKLLGVKYGLTEKKNILVDLQIPGHRIEIRKVKSGGLVAQLTKGNGEFLIDSDVVSSRSTVALNCDGNLIFSILKLLDEDDVEMVSIRDEAYKIGARLFCESCGYHESEGCGEQFHGCDCPRVHDEDRLIIGVAATRDGFVPYCPLFPDVLCYTGFHGCDCCPNRGEES